MRFASFIRHWLADRSGVALIEMVIVMPFLLFLLFGGLELARYALIIMKVDKAGYAITDLIAQEQTASDTYVNCTRTKTGINETQVRAALNQFSLTMKPMDNASRQMAIVSYVKKESGRLVVKWQVSGGGSLSTDVSSVVTGGGARGTCCRNQNASFSGEAATILASAPNDEYFVVGEVFYRYQPILQPILQGLSGQGLLPANLVSLTERTLVRRIYLRPRYGTLEDLPDTYPPAVPTRPSACT